jgi:hypothetical protein
MKKFSGFIALIAVLTAASLSAQSGVASLSGKWNMTITGHEGMSVTLEIKQEGKKLTANLVIPDHGDLELLGELVDGKLTLNSTENGYMQMSMHGDVKKDGTMSGNLSSTMGDMTWSGKRLTDE